MKHGVKKIKIRAGKDANEMLMRKLAFNFFTYGKIVTTASRAKALKSYLERLVEKTKEKTEANKNFLLRVVVSPQLLERLYTQVGPVIKDKNGGYVRLERLQQRYSDATQMMRVEWAYPVVMEAPKKEEETKLHPSGSEMQSEAKTKKGPVKNVEHKAKTTKAKAK